jgi:hypothetical protein
MNRRQDISNLAAARRKQMEDRPMIGSTQKMSPRASRMKSGPRVLWLAACITAVVTPRLSADITLVDRLSDARAEAHTAGHDSTPPPQIQTDFLPANLSNSASVPAGKGGTGASASSKDSSSIVVDNSMGTLRVTGAAFIEVAALVPSAFAQTSAKLIVLSFTLTDRSYVYSLTGLLPGSGLVTSTAKLTAGTSTIFEVFGFANLSETGTLPPGTYTLSVDYSASAHASGSPIFINTNAHFAFALDAPPGPTPTPTATPSPPTPTPIGISGALSYCSNPVPGPVPDVTVTLTGTSGGSTLSNGTGSYVFSFLPVNGFYTVTPTKTALLPAAAASINTVDVVATQRHFLVIGTPLSGCRLTAADVNDDTSVTTVDVIAIQRFFLGFANGTGNVGKYQFSPVNRTYSGIFANQTNQNYDTLIFGDVVAPFVAP